MAKVGTNARFADDGTKPSAQRTTKAQPKLVLFPEEDNDVAISDNSDRFGVEWAGRGGAAGVVLLDDAFVEGSSSASVDEGVASTSLSLAEKEALPRATAYCVAEGYRMDAVMQYLQTRHKVLPRVYDEVMHARYDERQKSRAISSHKEGIRMMPSLLDFHSPLFPNSNISSIVDSRPSNTAASENAPESEREDGFQTYADEQKLFRSNNDSEEDEDALVQRNPWAYADVFVFDYGVLVFWNFTEAEELVMLHRMQRFCIRPLNTKDIEIENLHCTLETIDFGSARGAAIRRKKKEKRERGLASRFGASHNSWTSKTGPYKARPLGKLPDRANLWKPFKEPIVNETTPLLSNAETESAENKTGADKETIYPSLSLNPPHCGSSSTESLEKDSSTEVFEADRPSGIFSASKDDTATGTNEAKPPVIGDNIQPNNSELDSLYNSKIVNDVIYLGSPSTMIKLTISHGLSQSVKLTFYENEMDSTIENTKQLPARLATLGKVKLSRRQITKIMGELYKLRMGVNLVSRVLDTPEWFWTERDSKTLYDSVCTYLEIHKRVDLLNVRTKVLSDLLDMLSDHLHSAAAIWSTWIIIILIVIAIVVALAEIAVKAMGFSKHNTGSSLAYHPSVRVFKFLMNQE